MKLLVLAHATYADPPTRRVFDHMASEGFEVLLAMPKRIKHPFGPASVPLTPWSTPVRLALLDTWYLHENGTHIVLKGVPRLIRDYRPDVIHCVMEPWSVTCLMVVATLSRTGGYRPRFGVQAAETLPQQGSLPVRWLRQSLYRRVLGRTDYFVGWSARAVDAAAALGLNGIPSLTAPALAVDTETFLPLPDDERARYRSVHGWSHEDLVIGFVGRFEEQKGVEDLVQAMDLAVGEEPRLRLALLGSGSLAGALRAAGRIRPWLAVLPATDAAGVARHMAALDLLVVPSRSTPCWDEQFGLVAVEAMACGTPVVASDSGSLRETVGHAALLVPQRDVAALSGSILSLARSRERRLDLARKGLERIREALAPAPLAHRLASFVGVR